MTFPIPKTISDVTPELCRRVFTDICGGKVIEGCFINGIYHDEKNVWEFSSGKRCLDSDFNPFLNIQDTKLCDPWLVGNKLLMHCLFRYCFGKPWWGFIYPADGDWDVEYFSETEEMARMCAILKAYNKMMGGE